MYKRSVLLTVVLALMAGGLGLFTTLREGLAGDPLWVAALSGTCLLGFTVGWFLFRLDGRQFERTGRTLEGIGTWTVVSIVLAGGGAVRLVDAFLPGVHIYPIGGWLLAGGTLAGAIEPTHRQALRKLAERRARERLSEEAEIVEWIRRRRDRNETS